MWSFRNNRLLDPVDVTVANLMAALGRYQGRQELYQHQAPQMLETLRQIAIVESTEASNRIEGIVVPPHRLRALMAQAAPETRSESEIAGYRDVLARIHTGQASLPLTPDAIRAVRLSFKMTQPLRKRDGTRGFRVQVEVLKNKLASPAKKPVTLDIYFNGTVDSNGII